MLRKYIIKFVNVNKNDLYHYPFIFKDTLVETMILSPNN